MSRIASPLLIVLAVAAPAAAGAPPARPVTVEDCVHAAVVNSLRLTDQRLGRASAALEVDRQHEVFWPILFFDAGLDADRTPATDGAVEGTAWRLDSGVEVRTPLGTRLGAGWGNTWADEVGGADAAGSEHEARFALTVTQPLLRGFGVEVNTTEVTRSRLALEIARQDFRQALNGLIRDVELAYWALYLAQEEAAVKARSLARAREQYLATAENIRRGLLPEHDIHVVEESRVSFERKHLDALNAVAAARIALGRLLQLSPAEAARLSAAEPPGPAELALPDAGAQLGLALARNPGLLAARSRLRAADVQLTFERNALLPRLDLAASLALNGLDDDAGGAHAQLVGGDRSAATFGVQVELPLFRLADDARVEQARIERRRRLLALEASEQALELTVADLRRDIEHGQRSYALAKRIGVLARAKLEAQQEKYRAGVAALKDVVQFLRELDEAEIDQLRALVAVHQRVIELHAAVGDLHRLRGLDVR